MGSSKCHFNQIEFSLILDDITGAAQHAFEAMRLSAASRDIRSLMQAFVAFGIRIFPLLRLDSSPVQPVSGISFSRLMDMISESAAKHDIDRLFGRVSALAERFDPGGRPST